MQVFDGNKQKLAVGDIYPEAVQLKKGEHVIRAVLRHDDAALLEKLKVGRGRFELSATWLTAGHHSKWGTAWPPPPSRIHHASLATCPPGLVGLFAAAGHAAGGGAQTGPASAGEPWLGLVWFD